MTMFRPVVVLLVYFFITISNTILTSEVSDDIVKESSELKQVERGKRSLTALLTAEIIVLEGILASQNRNKYNKGSLRSRRRKPLVRNPRKVSKVATKEIVPQTNYLDTPGFLKVDVGTGNVNDIIQTSNTKIIRQADPFTILVAPDLTTVTTWPTVSNDTDTSTKLPSRENIILKYGAFELYQPSVIPVSTKKVRVRSTPAKIQPIPANPNIKDVEVHFKKKEYITAKKDLDIKSNTENHNIKRLDNVYGIHNLNNKNKNTSTPEFNFGKKWFSTAKKSKGRRKSKTATENITPTLKQSTRPGSFGEQADYKNTFFTEEQATKVHQSSRTVTSV